jgi:4-diphosphocytidyl-2-C-methyl-D-erythritol kinase
MSTLDQFETINDSLLVRAPAKINLSLLITGKRPDGFHGIETIMHKINWYDEILFEPATTEGIELICQGPHWAPDGPDNLVYRACEMLIDRANINMPVKVTLTKNIPAGTGLGSASSDAAAAVMGLNRYANLNQPDAVLHEICAQLGSDINFFLGGPIAYCTGRGEKIDKIDAKFDFTALLITPNISVSTASVYKNYIHDISVYKGLSEKINPLLDKKKVDSIAQLCANMLQVSCFNLNEELARLKDRCQEFCGLPVCLSGSGSAMYILADTHEDMQLNLLREHLIKEYHCESRLVNNNRW